VRVALVHPHFRRSSSLERDTVLLAAGLVSAGAEVHVYCDPATRTADEPGVSFHDVRPIRMGSSPASSRLGHPLERASFAHAATQALRRDRRLYDVVDVRQTGAWEHDVVTVHGVVAAMQRRWPVETGRSYRAAGLRATAAPVLRPQIAVDRTIQARQLRPGRFRRVIAVTEGVRDDLASVHRVPTALVDIVPPPVDLDRIRRARPSGVRRSLGIATDAPLVLFVGHGFQRKGLDRLVEAVAGIPEAQVVVVGGGDPASVMRAAGPDLPRRIHFVGAVDDPERYYAEADLLALPTRSDPWGIPLIEAMAAGVPVVTTRFAGAADVLADAGAGIVLPDESPGELRAALLALIGDPARRRALGAHGPAAAERFGPEAHAAAVLDTYRRALDDADPRRDGLLVS
jgi:glycosyltransferase involved in cell wall biosynthesis